MNCKVSQLNNAAHDRSTPRLQLHNRLLQLSCSQLWSFYKTKSSSSGGLGIHPSSGDGGCSSARQTAAYTPPAACLAARYFRLRAGLCSRSAASAVLPGCSCACEVPCGRLRSTATSCCHCANSAALQTDGCAEAGTGWPVFTLAVPTFKPLLPATASVAPPASTGTEQLLLPLLGPALAAPAAAAPPAGSCCRFHLKAAEGGAAHTTDEPPATRLAADGASPRACIWLSLLPPPLLLSAPPAAASAAPATGAWMCSAGAAGCLAGGSRSAARAAVRSMRARRRAAAACSDRTCPLLVPPLPAGAPSPVAGGGGGRPTVIDARRSGAASRPSSSEPCGVDKGEVGAISVSGRAQKARETQRYDPAKLDRIHCSIHK